GTFARGTTPSCVGLLDRCCIVLSAASRDARAGVRSTTSTGLAEARMDEISEEPARAPRLSRRALPRTGAVAPTGAAAFAAAGYAPRGGRAANAVATLAASGGRSLTARVAPPAIVTRAQWGANERLRNGAPDYDATVEKIIVHHTATRNGPQDFA